MKKMAKYPYIEGSKDCCPCAPTIPDWVKMLFDAVIIEPIEALELVEPGADICEKEELRKEILRKMKFPRDIADYLGNENASLSAYIEIETEHVCYDEVMYV